ncbi:MAG: hypothetical protein EBU23_07870, partial [Mycobacteriaceae bacterium]|nr:hypothetical protein [Mycobacteriaceae bacterium]
MSANSVNGDSALDHAAAGFNGRDQCGHQRVDAALDAIASQGQFDVGDAVQRGRGPAGVAAVVGGVSAQQQSQVRLADMAVDGRGHAVQRIDGPQRSGMAHGVADHRRPGWGRAHDEMRGGGRPDPAAVVEEGREFVGLFARRRLPVQAG